MTMTITTERKTVVTLYANETQRAAIKVVDDMLSLMQDVFSDDTVFASLTTGECLQVEELKRVRGILDLFAQDSPVPILEVLDEED